MRRAWRGAMPVALTLPLALEHRPRTRQRRRRRFALAALIALALALIAAGLWLPAIGSAAPHSAVAAHGGTPPRPWPRSRSATSSALRGPTAQ